MSGGSSAADLATSLRQWRRAFQRAREIGASLPDGTLLVHGLEVAAVGLGKLDGQSAFRIASARSQLGVDECPDETNVLAYSQVLLAEAETLVLAVSSSASSGGGSGNANTNPKVKAMTTTSPTKPPGKPGGGEYHQQDSRQSSSFANIGGQNMAADKEEIAPMTTLNYQTSRTVVGIVRLQVIRKLIVLIVKDKEGKKGVGNQNLPPQGKQR